MADHRQPSLYSEPHALDDHEKEVFSKAMGGHVGFEYTPKLVSTQFVAGINYRYIANYKKLDGNQDTGEAIVTIYEELPEYGRKVAVLDIMIDKYPS